MTSLQNNRNLVLQTLKIISLFFWWFSLRSMIACMSLWWLHSSLIEFGLYCLVYFELNAPEVQRLDLFIISEALKLTSVCLDMCSDALVHDGTALLPVRPTLVCLDLNQECLTIWHCHTDVFFACDCCRSARDACWKVKQSHRSQNRKETVQPSHI